MWQEIRYAYRTLEKTPSFTAVAVLTLALGIGATTSVFSVFYGLLFNAFSAKDAHQLAVPITDKDEPLILSGADVASLRDQNQVFEDVVGYSRGQALVSAGNEVHQVNTAGVTANAFEFYGVPALLGRPISLGDGESRAPLVFVVSYRMWKDQFSGDPAVLGKTFTVAGKLRTLIGVMPPPFQAFGALTQVWMPFVNDSANGEHCQIIARLKPRISLNSASADMNVLVQRLAQFHPDRYPKTISVRVISATDFLLGPYGIGAAGGSDYGLKRMLYNLFGGVMLLLFIACANVGNLLLARSTVRQKEIAIRSALGASRARIVRQLLIESAMLASVAGGVGCVFAYFGTKWASTIIPHKGLSIGGETLIGLNPVVLLFACCVTVVTVLLCGLVPAFHGVPADLNRKLGASGNGSTGTTRQGRLRAGLLIGEVALSVILLVSSGLLIRSFFRLTHVSLGFKSQNLIFGAFGPSERSTYIERGSFVEKITHQLETMPGVDEVAINNSLPGYNTGPLSEATIPGRMQPLSIGFDGCSENLLSVMGLQLLRGRWLSATEVRLQQPVAVLNQTSARILFGNTDPIGQQIRVKAIGHLTGASFQVIGIAADTKNYNGPEQPTRPQAYIPYTIEGFGLFVIKTKSEPHSLMHAIQEQVWAVDPNVVFGHFETVEDTLYKLTYSAPEFGVAALAPIAGVGLLLIVSGIFSVMAYMVSLRTREIGVRMALGAQRGNILAIVFKRGIGLITLGAALGTLASLCFSKFLASQLWGISATDVGAFGTALSLIYVAGIAACYLPAQRAIAIDPIVVLRNE